ncbi:hypothetical protein AB0O34_11670 [Sphaerisporangium sp. NPDC088356]|uniref:hypothetical protein n=1 Tax=Sphaerisporangium sp. NPDC088356 TaxID=3154871 RepID=UPI00342E1A3B
MRTSLSFRGVLAVAAVTAGASWLGMGSALAATPADSRPLTSSSKADISPNTVNGLRLPSLHVAGHGGYGDGGDLLLGFEQIGQSSGMPTRTTTVVGLTDLPAIVRSTGLTRATRGQYLYDLTRGRDLSHVLRGEDPPVPGDSGELDTPGVIPAPAQDPTPAIAVLPIEPQTPAIVDPAIVDPGLVAPGNDEGTVITAEVPSLGTSLRDLRVR